MRRWTVTSRWLIAALMGIAVASAWSADDDPEEDRARVAAFVLKFVKYTSWPDGAFADKNDPLVIAVAGDSVALHLTNLIKGASAEGRPIRVMKIDPPGAGAGKQDWDALAQKLEGAHALFLDRQFQRVSEPVIRAARGRDLLTISDAPDFARRGGMLGLIPRGSRYYFEANLEAMKATALKVSSYLLNLAKIVEPRED